MAGKTADDKPGEQGSGDTAPSGKATAPQSSAVGTQQDSGEGAATKPGQSAQSSQSRQTGGVSKTQSAKSGTSAADLIKQDHREVERMFDAFEKTSNRNQKQRLVSQIYFALTTHTLIEEELFYPACRDKVDDDQLDEAHVEHDGAKQLIMELRDGSPSDPYYDAKVKVLSEYVKHHVREEEEPGKGILAAAEKAGVDMQALGREITARRAEFEQQARQEREPEMPSRASGGRRGQQSRSQPQDRQQSGGYGGGQDRDDDRRSSGRERGEYGRFVSDDNDVRGGRGRGSRYEDDEDRGGRGGQGGGQDRGGWFGDSRGHSEAARRGWDDPDERGSVDRSGGGRGGRDDDNDRGGRGRGGHGGWFGDPEGHSEAARRGWEDRDDDDRGRGRSSRGRDDDDDDDRGRERSSRGRNEDDDDDDRGRDRGQENRGWFGDSRGHAEAARRGWSDR